MKKISRNWIIAGGILVGLYILFQILGELYIDWLWFNEVGFQQIFTIKLAAKWGIGIVVAILVFALLYLNIAILRRLTDDSPFTIEVKEGNFTRQIDVTKIVNGMTTPILGLLGLFSGMAVAVNWEIILQFFYQVPFNQNDPIFGRDISYYIFSIPFWELLISLGYFIVYVSFAIAIVFFLKKGTVTVKNIFRETDFSKLKNGFLTIASGTKTHLLILLAVWFLLTAAHIYFIRMPNLLLNQQEILFGAGYTDIKAQLPFLWVLLAITVIGAALALFNIKKQSLKPIGIAFVSYFLVLVIGGAIIPGLLQKFIVAPNELNIERPYIAHHIEATQKAWGIDKVTIRELPADTALTAEDIKNNEATINNIRLWDRAPLLDTLSQIQEIRTYYDFFTVDDDRYNLDGNYRQVMLSPREMNSKNLPKQNFINNVLTFTHGMGLALTPVNEITEEGLPQLFVQDLPPQSKNEQLKIDRPELYYSEYPSEYVIVNSKNEEFNYPSGNKNVFTRYEGKGGLQISSLFKKALFAWHFNELKILLSSDVSKESRIMFIRDIHERAKTIFPFLKFDSDPYLVITDNRLVWLYDAYTTTNRYPYSKPLGSQNYMRNSVKISIDAYNGEVTAYVADQNDPLIQTYENMFPGTFTDISEMPQTLKDHIRYPEDYFALQTQLYRIYHMETPQVFYNREDAWEAAKVETAGSSHSDPMMRHLIMRLPDKEKEEFILMLPYTPRGKDNMAAWMVARSDNDNYGKLITYLFSKQALIFGPQQIINRINQNAEISQKISLWDQRGSKVVQGNLLVIPIEDSVLYVRPLYLRSEGNALPELRRVIIAHQDDIVMERTLDKGLQKLFGTSIDTDTQAEEPAPRNLKTPPQKQLPPQPQIQAQTHKTPLSLQQKLNSKRTNPRSPTTLPRSKKKLNNKANWSLYGEKSINLKKHCKNSVNKNSKLCEITPPPPFHSEKTYILPKTHNNLQKDTLWFYKQYDLMLDFAHPSLVSASLHLIFLLS